MVKFFNLIKNIKTQFKKLERKRVLTKINKVEVSLSEYYIVEGSACIFTVMELGVTRDRIR